MNMDERFDAALRRFLDAAQAMVDDYMATKFPTLAGTVLEHTVGARYVRVVSRDRATGLNRSAWCFVDRQTGDVLKCDGWKRPAKGARGSIYADAQPSGVTPYGGAYAR